MGIGAGLLGFVQGASSSLGAAAAQQVQSDIDMERQLSLDQILYQRNKTRTAEEFKQLYYSSTEAQELFDSPEELAATFGTEGGQAVFRLSQQREAQRKAEEQDQQVNTALTRFLSGQSSPEDQSLLVRTDTLNVSDLKGEDAVITADMLATIPEFANENDAVRQLYAANPTQAIERLEGKGDGEQKLPVDLVNVATGQIETVPFKQAATLLEAGTHTRGEIAFSGGEQVMRTPRGDFPFTSPKLSDDLTPRARTYAVLETAVKNMPEARSSQIAEADPEFIRPELAIDLATGPQDRLAAGLRAFGPTNALLQAEDNTLGEAQLVLKKELLALRSLTRNALVAANPGRANASTIELADELSPNDGTLAAIFGSGDNVRLTLENLRGLMRSIRTTNEETVGGSFTPQTADTANAAINNVNRVIGRIESLFASEQLGQLRLKEGGRTVTIANSKQLKSSSGVKEFLNKNAATLSRKEKALLFQWQRHLMLQEGF